MQGPLRQASLHHQRMESLVHTSWSQLTFQHRTGDRGIAVTVRWATQLQPPLLVPIAPQLAPDVRAGAETPIPRRCHRPFPTNPVKTVIYRLFPTEAHAATAFTRTLATQWIMKVRLSSPLTETMTPMPTHKDLFRPQSSHIVVQSTTASSLQSLPQAPNQAHGPGLKPRNLAWLPQTTPPNRPAKNPQ